MGHSHPHDHSHNLNGRNLLISIILNIAITTSQIIGGIISGSLALLSDAIHNFSDVLSLIISYVANRLVYKKASYQRTFGYKRSEIIAAFINSASLIIIAILLIIQAIERFQNPQKVESNLVIWLSLVAIFANGFSVLLLQRNSRENIQFDKSDESVVNLIADAQTSGGLLFSSPKNTSENIDALCQKIGIQVWEIGNIVSKYKNKVNIIKS